LGNSLLFAICRIAVLVALAVFGCEGAVKRVVIFKFDGVNAGSLDRWLARTDPRTGRSVLPWMNEIFVQQGTRVENFYVRGISLSAPSWSLLDTGHHQVIHGNVEYDRWTLFPYDYLNFFPFYFNYGEKKQVDMPGVEVLDEDGIPLLIDRFAPLQRWQSFQLYQRGNQWSILRESVPHHFEGRSPKQWFDEWQTGLELEASIGQELERELIDALNDDQVLYLDFFSGDWDHTAHLTNDPDSQLRAMQALDAAVGRIWNAAHAAPDGPETLFVTVSDHGMNTTPAVMSQGYSLVHWFNGAAGGGQHVITDRHPLEGYKLSGLDPFVHKVLNPSAESLYLQSDTHYPTVVLDLDGNERAAIQLRSNAWNVAQILLQQANRSATPRNVKAACRAELARWAEAERARWAPRRAGLLSDVSVLERNIPSEEGRTSKDLEVRRVAIRAAAERTEAHDYHEYVAAVDRFLAMPRNASDALVPKESLGPANSVWDLQHYVVGPAEQGIVLTPEGRIDMDRSFQRVDYFAALRAIRVRNQVQSGIGNEPVDFTAVPVDPAAFGTGLTGAIWLYAAPDRQAMVLSRQNGDRFEIQYLPVANLSGRPDGTVRFEPAPLKPGLPLHIVEDPNLRLPSGDAQWLREWHSDREWLDALHLTQYSNGLIGLTELFRAPEVESPKWTASLPDSDRKCLLDLARLRRELVAPDLEVFASDHWNFDVRNFNSGGNHGSFLRESTHSVLLFSGGAKTGIPHGVTVTAPHDSLDFVPTILKLMNLPAANLPGAPIMELTP
jgi:hypothetical protein